MIDISTLSSWTSQAANTSETIFMFFELRRTFGVLSEFSRRSGGKTKLEKISEACAVCSVSENVTAARVPRVVCKLFQSVLAQPTLKLFEFALCCCHGRCGPQGSLARVQLAPKRFFPAPPLLEEALLPVYCKIKEKQEPLDR